MTVFVRQLVAAGQDFWLAHIAEPQGLIILQETKSQTKKTISKTCLPPSTPTVSRQTATTRVKCIGASHLGENFFGAHRKSLGGNAAPPDPPVSLVTVDRSPKAPALEIL